MGDWLATKSFTNILIVMSSKPDGLLIWWNVQ